MRLAPRFLARLGLLVMISFLPINLAYSQTDVAKTFVAKMLDQIARLEKSCAKDVKRYCTNVTPGEGRMIYCMQAFEDKISPRCAFDLGEIVLDLQASTDALKTAVNACRVEIGGVCGKVQPGSGRIAACLVANKATVSKDCSDAIQKVESIATK